MHFITRQVFFKKGVCVGVGTGGELSDHDLVLGIPLPTDHYDFIGPLEIYLKNQTLQHIINTLYKKRSWEELKILLGIGE